MTLLSATAVVAEGWRPSFCVISRSLCSFMLLTPFRFVVIW